MDIKNAIDDIAKVLEPFATVIYIVGVAGTCVLASWAFLRGRLSTKDAEIRELKTINDHLRDENSKAENSIEKLKDEIKKLNKELDGLTRVALDKADQQVRDGKEENANSHLMEWLDLEAPLIAEVCCRLARWRLSAIQDEQHGEAAVPLTEPERLITIARALHPENRQLRELKYEILISKHNQDPAATAENLMRSLADEYGNLDPFILNKYADKYYEAGSYDYALALRKQATVILGETAGPNDRSTLISQGNLASVLHALDRLKESEALQREAWEAMKKHLRPDDREIFCSQHKLAQVLHDLKRLKESEALQRETWEAMKEHLGPDDWLTLTSQGNLAAVLRDLDRPEEAEALATATATPGDSAGESEAQP